MMNKLLRHYEMELALLRSYGRGFAERYPSLAGRLRMVGDECADPHAERVIQATALLAARISKRLEDDYPKFTESMLETLYPHYLRSFPCSSIVWLDLRNASMALPEKEEIIPRGTVMKTAAIDGVKCRFRTTSEIVIAPLALTSAGFHSHIPTSSRLSLPVDASSSISMTVSSAGKADMNALNLRQLRFFMHGDPTLCSALRDAIFMRCCAAYVSFGGADAWQTLRGMPIAAAGFAEEDALLPFVARSHPAYRLLTEYFAFPDKFQFIDLEWTDIAGRMPPGCRSFTLHLALHGVHGDARLARTLHQFSEQNLLLHCAPVVNLFSLPATPVDISHMAADYELLADTANPAAYEIYDIASARLITDVSRRDGIEEVQSFYGLRHGQKTEEPVHYWIMRRDDVVAELNPGHETRIGLVDSDLAPIPAHRQTLSVELLCSNRDLPSMLSHGMPDGDLTMEGMSHKAPLRLLRKPSARYRFDSGDDAHWRLISHLTLNHRDLSGGGVEELRKMLALYNLPRSAVSKRQIQGVVALTYKTVMAWIPGKPSAALMPGVEICLTLDEEAFVGSSIHLFIQVLDHFFCLRGQINVFTQLLAISGQSGKELMRCPRRSGTAILA